MAVVALGLVLFEQLTPGMAFFFAKYSLLFPDELVFSVFFLSETLLGLIPPDLFIVWAKQFPLPYLIVGVLSLLSYSGGLLAYFLGMKLVTLKKLNAYINVKFEQQFKMLKSWGGLIIIIAALFPLPYGTMCLGAGMLRFSFKTLLILGLFRIARFFIYASVLYQMI